MASGGNVSASTSTARRTATRNNAAAAEIAADVPLVSDIEITRYVSPAISLDKARLQTSGTRSAHIIQLSASNPDFDAACASKAAGPTTPGPAPSTRCKTAAASPSRWPRQRR
jgi:translocation and assembly module TamB